jgi:hypothetical protein
VRQRAGRLRADPPELDPVGQEGLYQSEYVTLAHLPPARPAQDRRPVDQSDAVNLRLDADIQPGPHGVPQRLDWIGHSGGGHRVSEPPGDIGLDRFHDRVEQRRLVRELVVQRSARDPGRRDDRVGRHVRETLRREQPPRRGDQRLAGRGRAVGLRTPHPRRGGSPGWHSLILHISAQPAK